MSFSTSRKIALDPARSRAERFVAARSCAMLVGQKWRVRRGYVLDHVRRASGVDLISSTSVEDIERAMAILVQMKERGPRFYLAEPVAGE